MVERLQGFCGEYKAGERHGSSWRVSKRVHLKLVITSERTPKKVGDTLMFSKHQTILASLQL